MIHGSSWYGSAENQTSEKVTESMIETDVQVSNSQIHRSTLLKGTVIGENSVIESSLIGDQVTIGSDVRLQDVVVDHGSTVPSGTTLVGGQWPRTE
jgi:ADP-glucose pyrophosphorylase